MSAEGWVGVDLDGTLAVYDGWKGADHVGAPIQKMVDRVNELLRARVKVKIFTARVSALFVSTDRFRLEECTLAKKAIEQWCLDVFGTVLEVTAVKDYEMHQLWDDRCKQVIGNTGVFLEEELELNK